MSVPSLLSIFGNSGEDDPVYVDDVFSTYLYRSYNTANRTINNGLDLDGKGGLVWLKKRNGSGDNLLYDTDRWAVTQNTRLRSNSSSRQVTGYGNDFGGFNSNGFDVKFNMNANNGTYASWSFRKQKGFLDIVSYTGNGISGRNISHSLGSVPGMIMVKCITEDYNWQVYHRSAGNTKYLILNSNTNPGTSYTRWDNTTPTSAHFRVGSANEVNQSGKSYIAYIFAHDDASFGTDGDESIIKCGTYTGGTSPFQVDIGFEPQWILIKNISSVNDWVIHDSTRQSHEELLANYASSEVTENTFNLSSTGLSLGSGSQFNGSGNNYIYMAIRRPHKPPESGTEVYAMDTFGGTSPTPPTYYSGFPVDFALNREINATQDFRVYARLMGPNRLRIPNVNPQLGDTGLNFDQNDGIQTQVGTLTAWQAWMFKRAPGFMDVVTYTGTGVTRTVNHNLTVKPEFMIIKIRNQAFNWMSYDKVNGATNYMQPSSNNATIVSSSIWNNTEPTSSVFTVAGASGNVNYSGGDMVAYLFATLPGISKVGSYTGNGSARNIDCGFTNGARFIMIKRTDSSGDWYIWDTLRGIVSGNDSYLRLNNTAAEVTNTDYIDPLSAGFAISSSAPAGINASGGTYLFLAIA